MTMARIGQAVGAIIIASVIWHTCCHTDNHHAAPPPQARKTTIGDTWSADDWAEWNKTDN